MWLHCCLIQRAVPLSKIVVRNLTICPNYGMILSKGCLTRPESLLKSKFKFCPLISVRALKRFDPGIQHVTAKHKEDKIDPNYRMIYHNNLWKYYEYGRRVVVLFAFPILLLDLACIYQNYFGQSNENLDSFTLLDPTLFASVSVPTLFASISFIFIVVLLLATLRSTGVYMARMYHNPKSDNFIGIIHKGLFGKKQFHFTVKDVKPVDVGKTHPILLWIKGNVSIKGRSFLFNYKDFTEFAYFNRFVGHTVDQEKKSSPFDDVRTIGEHVRKQRQLEYEKKRQEGRRSQEK